MKKFYKVFLVLFIVFITINLYAINWQATDILEMKITLDLHSQLELLQ